MRQYERGFTLIEMMLVVIIIGVLAAMVIPRFTGQAEQARIKVAQADVNSNIATPLKLYEMANGMFPTTEQGLAALLTKPTTSPVPSNWQQPYLEKIPIDPWGRAYQYKCPGPHRPHDFDLWSSGKDGQDGTEDDVVNWQK